MTLTPIDTLKTTQQTQGGKAGLKLLRDRIKENGVGCLWWGALATAAATFAGNCESTNLPQLFQLTGLDPWFGTYNFLSEKIPQSHDLVPKLFVSLYIRTSQSRSLMQTEIGIHRICSFSRIRHHQQQSESREDLSTGPREERRLLCVHSPELEQN
jgi:hypothetical protein